MKAVLIQIAQYTGRYTDYETIIKIIYPTLKGDMFGVYQDIHIGALIAFKYIIDCHSKNNIYPLGEYGRNFNYMI